MTADQNELEVGASQSALPKNAEAQSGFQNGQENQHQDVGAKAEESMSLSTKSDRLIRLGRLADDVPGL